MFTFQVEFVFEMQENNNQLIIQLIEYAETFFLSISLQFSSDQAILLKCRRTLFESFLCPTEASFVRLVILFTGCQLQMDGVYYLDLQDSYQHCGISETCAVLSALS